MSAGAVLDGLAPGGRRPSLRLLAPPLVVAGAYYLGAKAAFAIGTLTQQFAPFWPPNVVLLCAFLVTPRRSWPLLILACLPVHVLAEHGIAMPAAQLFAAFGGNVAVALLSAHALLRLLPERNWFSDLRSAVTYMHWAVVLSPALVACAAAFEPILGNGSLGDYGQFWWRWYLSNALGNLTLTPLFLTWVPYARLQGFHLPDRRRLVEIILLASGLSISCALAFAFRSSTAAGLFPALIYLPMPFLLAIAVRFGSKGATAGIVIFTVALLISAMENAAPAIAAAASYRVLSMQLFLAEAAIPVILLAALVEELQRSNKDLALALDERNRAEIAARATEALLQSSLNALGSRFAILNEAGQILAANSSWAEEAERIAPCGEQYFVGRNYLKECDRGRPHQQQIAHGLRRVIDGELAEFRFEYRSDFVAERWHQVRGTRFFIEGELRVVVTHEDITEVKRSEYALRRLSGRLMRAQDESRRQIARDLHDSTAQNLLGAALGIGQALRLMPRLKLAAKAALEESRALIDQSQREIRTVSYLLHPPMLDEAGLPATLRWLCDGFSKRTEILVALDLAVDIERLPAEIEAALFRVAQEALTNVHRHSGSHTARVDLGRALAPDGGSQIIMAIRDNGRGMPAGFAALVPQDESHLGIGLPGMRERLRQLGGYLRIESDEHGTIVRATVPCETPGASKPGI
jgi:two-component system NarL family sensor kinase